MDYFDQRHRLKVYNNNMLLETAMEKMQNRSERFRASVLFKTVIANKNAYEVRHEKHCKHQ